MLRLGGVPRGADRRSSSAAVPVLGTGEVRRARARSPSHYAPDARCRAGRRREVLVGAARDDAGRGRAVGVIAAHGRCPRCPAAAAWARPADVDGLRPRRCTACAARGRRRSGSTWCSRLPPGRVGHRRRGRRPPAPGRGPVAWSGDGAAHARGADRRLRLRAGRAHGRCARCIDLAARRADRVLRRHRPVPLRSEARGRGAQARVRDRRRAARASRSGCSSSRATAPPPLRSTPSTRGSTSLSSGVVEPGLRGRDASDAQRAGRGDRHRRHHRHRAPTSGPALPLAAGARARPARRAPASSSSWRRVTSTPTRSTCSPSACSRRCAMPGSTRWCSAAPTTRLLAAYDRRRDGARGRAGVERRRDGVRGPQHARRHGGMLAERRTG